MIGPWQRSPDAAVGTCRLCEAFEDDPRRLEAMLPGLASLSSAAASVRSDDGLCSVHDRFTGARHRCPAFRPRDFISSR